MRRHRERTDWIHVDVLPHDHAVLVQEILDASKCRKDVQISLHQD